jgi:Ca2+-transporting ATPase
MALPVAGPDQASEAWRRDAREVAAGLAVDTRVGLGAAEAADRLHRVGENRLEAAAPVPAWRKLLAQLANPLIYLLLAAVVVSLVVWILDGARGVPFDAVVIVVIITLNAVLGYVQEARAEDAVAALQRMTVATAGVVRDGREQRIASTQLVPGDVLTLSEGDAVGADARLVEAASLFVAEASLTGESEAVPKDAAPITEPVGLADRTNMVFQGTAVTRGHGRAVVTATGMSTEMGNVARLLDRTDDRDTPLQREVDHIGRMLGLAVMVITVIVVTTILLTSDVSGADEVLDVLLVGVSLAVAAVPEGLPAVLSVVLALGVQRMAGRRAIVKRLSSVETLGSATVVCTDKTGTLTTNEMTVVRVVTPSGSVDVTGAGYRPLGEFLVGDHPVDDPLLLDEVRLVLAGGSLAGNAVLSAGDGSWSPQGDPTEAAFLVAEAKLADLADARRTRFSRVGELPFTSERKLMSTVERDAARGGRTIVVTKGAPDVLLERCTRERRAGSTIALDDGRRGEALAAVERLADGALRTLAVAYRPLDEAVAQGAADDSIERDLIYLGTVGIVDPPRPEARAAIAEAHAAGLRVVMITGDHPRTAVRIAEQLGIVAADQADRAVMPGSDIECLDEAALQDAVGYVRVYARVSPEHKLRIVAALQADLEIVAMTGDGVNDAPALKAADIGVAMGIAGTDVTKQAADMVLADDNFATIVTAIREGRAIFANIRRFLRFLLSSNVGEVLTMFLGVLLAGVIGLDDAGDGIAVPLLATQILWINLLTDTAPALAMGVEPPPDDVMTRPPRRLTDRVIDRQMWFGIVWVGTVMALAALAAFDLGLEGGLLGGSGDLTEARTMTFTTLVLAQLFNAFNARSDRVSAFHHLFTNAYLWAAVALSVVLQAAVVHVPLLNDAFDTSALDLTGWLVCAGLGSTVLWAAEANKLVRRAWAGRPAGHRS